MTGRQRAARYLFGYLRMRRQCRQTTLCLPAPAPHQEDKPLTPAIGEPLTIVWVMPHAAWQLILEEAA